MNLTVEMAYLKYKGCSLLISLTLVFVAALSFSTLRDFSVMADPVITRYYNKLMAKRYLIEYGAPPKVSCFESLKLRGFWQEREELDLGPFKKRFYDFVSARTKEKEELQELKKQKKELKREKRELKKLKREKKELKKAKMAATTKNDGDGITFKFDGDGITLKKCKLKKQKKERQREKRELKKAKMAAMTKNDGDGITLKFDGDGITLKKCKLNEVKDSPANVEEMELDAEDVQEKNGNVSG